MSVAWSKFSNARRSPETVICPAIDGIIEEADEVAGEVADKNVLDAALIAAAQAVEHYEMTRYGTLVAWAKRSAATIARQCSRKIWSRKKQPTKSLPRSPRAASIRRRLEASPNKFHRKMERAATGRPLGLLSGKRRCRQLLACFATAYFGAGGGNGLQASSGLTATHIAKLLSLPGPLHRMDVPVFVQEVAPGE